MTALEATTDTDADVADTVLMLARLIHQWRALLLTYLLCVLHRTKIKHRMNLWVLQCFSEGNSHQFNKIIILALLTEAVVVEAVVPTLDKLSNNSSSSNKDNQPPQSVLEVLQAQVLVQAVEVEEAEQEVPTAVLHSVETLTLGIMRRDSDDRCRSQCIITGVLSDVLRS
jgi:hypothetical protein